MIMFLAPEASLHKPWSAGDVQCSVMCMQRHGSLLHVSLPSDQHLVAYALFIAQLHMHKT